VVTDVSGQPASPVIKDQAFEGFLDCLTLEVGSIGCPETSVGYLPTHAS